MSQTKIGLRQEFLQIKNQIDGYGDNYIVISNKKIHFPFILTEEFVITSPIIEDFDWSKYEVILIASLANSLKRNMSFIPKNHEKMDFRAACRTYNILLSEGRKVVLLIE